MFAEFKKFVMRGNVMDMAVGIIIGAAFGKIVSSFVNDVLMPPLGLIVGNVDFNNLFLNLGPTAYATLAEAKEAGAPTLNYGSFIQTVFDFLIVAFAIFLMVKQTNKLMAKEAQQPAAPPAPTKDQVLLEEIRDLLKQRTV